MTLEEYDEQMRIFETQLRMTDSDAAWNEVMERINDFQYEHMREFVAEYRSKADTKAKKEIADIFEYAVEKSESGSAIGYVDSEELANEIDKIIWEEIGDFMLDPPEVYKEKKEYGGQWCISCMFGGFYVPWWDGWND